LGIRYIRIKKKKIDSNIVDLFGVPYHNNKRDYNAFELEKYVFRIDESWRRMKLPKNELLFFNSIMEPFVLINEELKLPSGVDISFGRPINEISKNFLDSLCLTFGTNEFTNGKHSGSNGSINEISKNFLDSLCLTFGTNGYLNGKHNGKVFD